MLRSLRYMCCVACCWKSRLTPAVRVLEGSVASCRRLAVHPAFQNTVTDNIRSYIRQNTCGSYRIVSRYFVWYRILSIVFLYGCIVPSLIHIVVPAGKYGTVCWLYLGLGFSLWYQVDYSSQSVFHWLAIVQYAGKSYQFLRSRFWFLSCSYLCGVLSVMSQETSALEKVSPCCWTYHQPWIWVYIALKPIYV